MVRLGLLTTFLLCAHAIALSQLRYSTIANTSTMTRYGYDNQMAIQSRDNILISFKRGTGSTSADRQILVAHSTNAGRTFVETDVTTPSNTDTQDPIIASTTSSAVAIYKYDSSGVGWRTCIARSTNSGGSFSLSSLNLNVGSQFISDGVSKYYLCDETYDPYAPIVSTDNGATFKQMKVPPDASKAEDARWACTTSYLWVVYDKSAADSIYIYRSSDNGSSYQFVGQYFVDLPSTSDFSCWAANDQLYITWVHEEVGIYSLRMRTVTGTTLGTINTVISGTSNIYYEPIIKNSTNRVFISLGDQIFLSTDGGVTWSRGSNATTEVPSYPEFASFASVDDTTIYINFNISSTGSERQTVFANWKWTDFPITSLTDDTLITTNSYVDIDWWNRYVETPTYHFQMSTSSNFSPVLFDTTGQDYADIQMNNRFPANSTRYYYHVRGEDVGYNTSWSPTKSFRYGSLITVSPTIIAPANGTTVNYPNLINCQWSSLEGIQYYSFHLSSSESFTDTLSYYYAALANTTLSVFPVKNNAFFNGTFYWHVRGMEYQTGSVGPWSQTATFKYSGVTKVTNQETSIPKNYFVAQNYPNPFNPTTTISFGVPAQSHVTVEIYDLLGRRVANLINDDLQAGYYHISWSAVGLVSGIYIYRMAAQAMDNHKNSFTGVKELILLK